MPVPCCIPAVVAFLFRIPLLSAWVLAVLFASGAASAEEGESSRFDVTRQADEFVVEGWLSVAVPPSVAWAVLTDYDRMAEFIPDMRESRRLNGDGGGLRVWQKGVTRVGPFSFDYEVEREVWVTPETLIRSHGIRGNMKKLELETALAPDPVGVRIHYRAEIVPDFWVPPLLGPRFIRSQAEQQFRALIAEMKRRAAAARP